MRPTSAALPPALRASPTRIITAGAGVTIVLVLLITALGWDMFRSYRTVTTKHLQLLRSIDRLDYVDEVLTMSSRMAAATGDLGWEERYRRFEPEVDALLEQILRQAPAGGQPDAAAGVRAATDTLLAMEERAFRWIQGGEPGAAAELLASPAYERQKQRYTDAVEQITAALEGRIEAHRRSLRRERFLFGLFSAISVLVLAGMWLALRRLVRRHVAERDRAEAQLQESERHFRALIDNISDAVTVLEPDGSVRYVSRSFERITGYSAEERAGRSAFERVHPDDLEAVRTEFRRLVEEPGARVEVQPRLRHKDGRWRTVRLIGQNLLDDPGVGGIVVTYSDLTERTEAEEALRESERRFRALIENGQDVITLLDHEGVIRYESPSIERVLGYDPGELIGRSAFQQVHPEDLPAVGAALQGVLQQPGRKLSAQYRSRHKDGSWRWIESTGTNALEDPVVQGVVVNSRDVTERQRAEEELEAQRAFLRAVVDSSPSAVFVKDAEGRFTLANPAMAGFYGLSPEEMVGKTDAELGLPEERAEHFQRMDRQVIETGEAIFSPAELTTSPHTGEARWFETRKIPLSASGGGRQVLGIATDVTERREAEERERQLIREKITREEAEAAQQRIRGILESITDGFFAVDEHWHVTYANREILTLASKSREEVLGKSLRELYPLPAANRFWAEYHRAVEEQVAVEFEDRDPNTGIWAQVRAYPHEEGLAVFVRDITERKQAEEALHESKLTLQTILAASPDIVEMLDLEGRFRWVSPAMHDVLGYGVDEVEGRAMQDLLANEDREALECFLHQLVEGGTEEVRLRYAARHSDGHWVRMEGRGRAIRNEVLRGVVLVARDVTEQEQLMGELQQSLREKEALLQEVHHRVKNNLQVISSLLSMQMRTLREPEALEALRESRERIHSMALIHETLYSTGDFAEIDLAGYLKRLALQLRRSLGLDSGILLKLDLERCPVPLDVAVPLGLIASELVTNAFKHAFPGEASGEVRVELQRNAGGAYALIVGDNGVGLPEGEVGESSVGMNLIHGLVRQVGGELEVRRGAGTEVRITFEVQDQGE